MLLRHDARAVPWMYLLFKLAENRYWVQTMHVITDSDKIVEKMANQIKPMILWKSNDTFSQYSSVLVLPYDDDWPNSGLSRILLDYPMQSLSNVYPIFTQHVSNVSPEDCQNPNLVNLVIWCISSDCQVSVNCPVTIQVQSLSRYFNCSLSGKYDIVQLSSNDYTYREENLAKERQGERGRRKNRMDLYWDI